MDHLTLFKLVVGSIAVLMSICGLTTRLFSFRDKQFYQSNLLFVYSFAVMTCFTLLYTKEIFTDYINGQFDLNSAAKLYSYMSIVASIINYLYSLFTTNASLGVVNKVNLLNAIEELEVSKEHLLMATKSASIKTLLFPLVIEVTLVLRQLHNDPDRNLLWTLYTLLPTLISSILPNYFFSALALCNMLILTLNLRLKDIVKEVNSMQSDLQMRLQKPYYRMQRFCDLSDKLDTLAVKYTQICTLTTERTGQLAVPFLCSLLCSLLGILAGLFRQYYALADYLINDENYDLFDALTNCVFLIISFCEIMMQAFVCNDTLLAIQKTGVILQRAIVEHADIRFKKSMEAFSLLILTTKFKIKPLGLLEINITLLYDLCSAVTGFLLILIQSDLSLRYSLK